MLAKKKSKEDIGHLYQFSKEERDIIWKEKTYEIKRRFPKRPIACLINKAQLWWKECPTVTGWYQEGNKMHIRIQRIGLFRKYCSPIWVETIDIDPTLVVQPQISAPRYGFFT